MVKTAIGFRVHSGWAAMVAVAGELRSPEIIHRCRIEFIDPASPKTKQPYHAARELTPAQATTFVAECFAQASQLALAALRQQIELMREKDQTVERCALLLASGRPLPTLEKILGSHPMLHTAEGEHFRNALRSGCQECHLTVISIRERELFDRAAKELNVCEPQLRSQLSDMGRTVGAPWREDEKLAALAAWLVLAAPSTE